MKTSERINRKNLNHDTVKREAERALRGIERIVSLIEAGFDLDLSNQVIKNCYRASEALLVLSMAATSKPEEMKAEQQTGKLTESALDILAGRKVKRGRA